MLHARSAAEQRALYSRLAPQLARVLSATVQADEEVLEEARHLAWIRLLCGEAHVDEEHALGWLATTARREALRMLRRNRAHPGSVGEQVTPEDAAADRRGASPALSVGCRFAPPPPLPTEAVAELRERLRTVDRLPLRQRRLVWLQAAGYDYAEMAERTGETLRSVERQLRYAKRTLTAASAA